jgi:hypothetical protein
MMSDFEDVLKSHYSRLTTPFPKHMISDNSPEEYKGRVLKALGDANPNFEVIDQDKNLNASQAFESLILSTKTPFLDFVFTDVISIGTKDYIAPCVKVMEQNPDVMQVCVGGTFIESDNDGYVIVKEGKAYLDVRRPIEMSPYTYLSDTVWVAEAGIEQFSDFMFVMAFWNQILRTEMCKKFVETTRNYYNPPDSSIELYIIKAHRSVEVPGYNLPPKWNAGYEWLSQYRFGFLNFNAYIFPIDRLPMSKEQFEKDHEGKEKGIEILNA